MLDTDLSDYAILFILGIIAICAALSCLGYKLRGREGAGATVLLSIIGMWISLCIVNAAGFEDATPATVLTICIVTVILPSAYNLYAISGWKSQKKAQQIRDKMQLLQQELNDIEKKIDYGKAVPNFLSLLKKCNADVSFFESHKEIARQKELIAAANSIKKEIHNLSLELQAERHIK